jgi:hypothetical protein
VTAPTLAGKTILMSGGSRGIGLAIALRAARDGANVVLLAKTAEPHPKLEGTIYTAMDQLLTGALHLQGLTGQQHPWRCWRLPPRHDSWPRPPSRLLTRSWPSLWRRTLY